MTRQLQSKASRTNATLAETKKESKAVIKSLKQTNGRLENKLHTIEELSNTRKITLDEVVPALQAAEENVRVLNDENRELREQSASYYNDLRIARRRYQRAKAREQTCKGAYNALMAENSTMRVSYGRAKLNADEALETISRLNVELAFAHEQTEEIKTDISALRQTLRALKKRCQRAPVTLVKAIAKAAERERSKKTQSKTQEIKLCQKGVYTIEACRVMRLLVSSGCAPAKVGSVLEKVARLGGLAVKGECSRRTVQHAILEGGLASHVQLGHELSIAKGTR